MQFNKITIEASILANPKKVWEFYTNSIHIVNWNFASDDWHCPSATSDLRVGGKNSSRMEAKDGSFGFDFVITYNEIIPEQKIAYSMEDGRQAIVLFEKMNDAVNVTITFDAENENALELQKFGWQSILNNFKKYTENN